MHKKPELSFENLQVAFASKSDGALKKMFLMFAVLDNKTAVKWSIWLASLALKWHLPIKGFMKKTIFGHFCGGESIPETASTVDELNRYHIGAILDYSVEAEDDEKSFDRTRDEILRTIDWAASADYMPFAVLKVTGLGDYKIMAKIQTGRSLTEKEKISFENTKDRVDQLCKAAFDAKIRILVDGEESWFQDVIDNLVDQAMEKYNKKTAVVYNTYQMYRKNMKRNIQDAHHEAVSKGYFLGVKLVRGAYLEKEAKRAEKKGYPNPIQPDKESTDQAFNEAMQFCINNKQRIFLVNGTHNEWSNYLLAELMFLHGLKPDDERVFFAQLYGMSDHISYNLARAGYNVAKYVPYGPIEAVMPYLSRRAAENTGISGQNSRELVLIKKEMARRRAVDNPNNK